MRVAWPLRRCRNAPATGQDALRRALAAVSDLLADVPEIAGLDINPLLFGDADAIALDTRVRLGTDARAGARHFATYPCPQHLVGTVPRQGRSPTLRPIGPEDHA